MIYIEKNSDLKFRECNMQCWKLKLVKNLNKIIIFF